MVILDWFLFFLYRFLFLPGAVFILRHLKPLLPQKLQVMIQERDLPNLQPLPARPIWIHASSGEIEYAKSIIREFKLQFPQTPILVTYFSPSAKKLIQNFPGIDLAMALPWDRPKDLQRFLKFYDPRCLLIARTDVWPEVAYQVKKQNIPSVLFAATLASNSSRVGVLAGALTRFALHQLNHIFAVSPLDQEAFINLGVKTPLTVTGDTRFDQVLYRLQYPQPHRSELRPHGPLFVMGSTWPADDHILIQSVQTWIHQGGRAIWAPHEVSQPRLLEISDLLEKNGLAFDFYSQCSDWQTSILIVDQVGVLQELYSWATVAFVGGSFKDKVHSVMEPLCVGIPVLVGPFHANNREAIQFQHVILDTGFYAVQVVQNSTEISSALTRSKSLFRPHPKIIEKVQQASGGTEKLLSYLIKENTF